MNWRSDMILNESMGLKGLFDKYKAEGSTPIQLKTVAPAFSLLIKPKSENLPAVSFGYGRDREAQGGITEGQKGSFNIYIYAEIDATADKNIIERTGDMHTCVQEVVMSLRTYYAPGVTIHNVRIADAIPPEIKVREKEYMLFVVRVEYEEFFDFVGNDLIENEGSF